MRSFTVRTGTDGCSSRMNGVEAISDSGWKSLTWSYGRFLYSVGLIENVLATKSAVYPSGAALAAMAAPSVPDAPGRLSTMTDCPIVAASCCANTRATMSCPPPVGWPTMNLIGLFGYDCAVVSERAAAQVPPVTRQHVLASAPIK